MSPRGAAAVLLIGAALTAVLPGVASAREPGAPVSPVTAPTPSASPSLSPSPSVAGGAGQWPLKSLDAAALWRRARGAGISIAVVDTGVDAGEPDLRHVVTGSRDLLAGSAAAASPSSHGTEVAELIAGNGSGGPAGLAPAASVVDIRVATRLSAVTAAAIAAGIAAAVKAGAQVINVSAGVRQDTSVLRAAVLAAERDGRLVVASAGGSAAALYPAAIAGVLSVGAENQNGNRAATPSGTRLFAPGTGVFPHVSVLDGSEFAAAYVSAAAALLLSASRSLTPPAAGDILATAAGTAKLLDPGRALDLATAPPAARTPSASPTGKHASTPPPGPRGSSSLTDILVLAIVIVVLFGAFIGFAWRRTSRAAAGGPQRGQPAQPPRPPGDGQVLQPSSHEPFSWDQSW